MFRILGINDVRRVAERAVRTISANRKHNSKVRNSDSEESLIRIQPDAFVQVWLLNGYHTNAYRQTRLMWDYLRGEDFIAPTDGQVSNGKPWFMASSKGSYFDLGYCLPGGRYCVAYAHTYIHAASASDAHLWIGSSDGVKVWVNGKIVWIKVDVCLLAGWNRLLVKISQGRGKWGFSLAICNSDGDAVQNLVYCLYPPSEETMPDAIS
jgi:hypothetical protein